MDSVFVSAYRIQGFGHRMIFQRSGCPPGWTLNRSVINALFIGGLTWGGNLYIHIRGESGGKKVYSSGTMLLQGWLPVSRRACITRVSPLRVLSARGGGAKLSCKFLLSLDKYIHESSCYE